MPEVKPGFRILRNPLTFEMTSVPAADADRVAAERGLVYASLQQIDAETEREKYGTGREQLRAGLDLGVEALTLGGIAQDSPEDQARRRVFRRESPGAAFGAEAAGVVGAAALGAATGGTLAGAAGLGRAGAATVAALSEGAVGGYAQEQVRAREAGEDISAGNIALFGVLPSVAGRFVPKAAGAMFSRAANKVEDVLGSSADNVLVQAEQKAAARGAYEIDGTGPAPGRVRDEFLDSNHQTAMDQSANDFTEAMDRRSKAFSNLIDISKKSQRIRQLVSKDNPAQRQLIRENLERIDGLIVDVDAFADVQGLQGMVGKLKGTKKVQGILPEARDRILAAKDPTERFIAVEQTKRVLQHVHKSLAHSQNSAIDSVYHGQLKQVVEDVQESLRVGLEREDAWGSAGRFQQDVNGGLHDDWFQGVGVAENDLARITGTDYDARRIVEFDPAKVRGYLEKDATGRGLTPRKLDQMIRGQDRVADAFRKWGLTDESSLAKMADDGQIISRARAVADEIPVARKNMSDVRAQQAAKDKADALATRQADKSEALAERQAAAKDQAIGDVALAGGTLLGAAISGPVGGAIGFAAGSLVKAMRVQKALRTIQQAGQAQVRGAARTMVNGLPKALRAAANVANKAGEVTGPLAVVAVGALRKRDAPVDRFRGEYPTISQAYVAKREQILAALQNPLQAAQAITNSLPDTVEHMPDLHFRLTTRITQALDYLSQHLPAGVELSLLSATEAPPDVQDIRQFADVWEAVMNPGEVVDDMGTMQATPAQFRALEAVHPDLYGDLRHETILAVAQSIQRPSWERLRYIEQAFRLGPELGGAWTKQTARNIRNAMFSAPPPSTGPSPARRAAAGPAEPRGLSAIASGPTSGVPDGTL